MPRHANEEAWLETREHGLGASEVSASVGMNPWESRYKLWARKTKRIVPFIGGEQAERFFIAHQMEPVIARIYEWKTGGRRTVTNPGKFTTKKHPKSDCIFSTPDYYQLDPDKGRGVLECKTTGQYMAGEWEHGAPMHYQIQLQIQLACSGCKWGTLAALIGGNRFVHWDYERNNDFIAELLANAEHFWNAYVIGDYPPPIDWMPSTRETIQMMHPKDSGETIVLPTSFDVVAEQFDRVKAGLKVLEKERDELKNKIMAGIGDASFAELSDGSGFSLKWWEKQGYEAGPSQGRTLRRKKAPKQETP